MFAKMACLSRRGWNFDRAKKYDVIPAKQRNARKQIRLSLSEYITRHHFVSRFYLASYLQCSKDEFYKYSLAREMTFFSRVAIALTRLHKIFLENLKIPLAAPLLRYFKPNKFGIYLQRGTLNIPVIMKIPTSICFVFKLKIRYFAKNNINLSRYV